jgi:hypothetical protein
LARSGGRRAGYDVAVRVAVLVLLLLLAGAGISAAQTPPPAPCGTANASSKMTLQPFAERPWYQPLIAEPRGAQTQFYVWGQAKPFPYMVRDQHINVWEVNFGKELPLGTIEKGATDGSLLDCRGWGFGAWASGSFHMILSSDHGSEPVLNQDYRFAGVIKAAKALTPRDLISMKVQLGHESTHLGDEFVVRAIDFYGDAFVRVNVSYEYVEFGASWDHFLGAQRQHSISFRGSAVETLGSGGWYSSHSLSGQFIYPSAVNVEPAVGVEYLPQGSHGWRPFASYDGRLRTIYDYQKTSADQREDRQFSSSLVVGLRQMKWANKGMPDLVARAYYGVNPHGQFRSQSDFWMLAIGVMLRL